MPWRNILRDKSLEIGLPRGILLAFSPIFIFYFLYASHSFYLLFHTFFFFTLSFLPGTISSIVFYIFSLHFGFTLRLFYFPHFIAFSSFYQSINFLLLCLSITVTFFFLSIHYLRVFFLFSYFGNSLRPISLHCSVKQVNLKWTTLSTLFRHLT